jgi:NAD+ synthase (glutamine-hydrolysing)
MPDDPLELVHRAIVLGIYDYVRKNGFAKVIVGLSGGIDSAVVAALAVEALGPDAVTGVFLPSAVTSRESREDAQEIAQRLSIEWLEVPIEEAVKTCRNVLPKLPTGIVGENLQARARGVLLMALANGRDALVLATGNKTEIALGYNTLYGDTVGALAPLGDLYKSEVYKLSEAFTDRIPKRVMEKAPSAELRPDQRDEDDLHPYSILDPLLGALIEGNGSREELIAQGFSEPIVNDVLTRYFRSEYKRRQLPPAILVSAGQGGGSPRMPITHSHRG